MRYSDENKYIENNWKELFEEIKEYLYFYLFDGELCHVNIYIKKFFNLSSDELDLLKFVHFMSSSEVKDFFNILPLLLRNLSHSSCMKNEMINGNVKSKIDWINTFKIRFSKGFNDKTLFVSSQINKLYDLEENQLLKFILVKIIKLSEKFSFLFEKNINNISENQSFNFDKSFFKQLNFYYYISRKSFKKIYFDEISDIEIISKNHLNKAFFNKNKFYKKIFDVYILYEKLFINYDFTTFKRLVEKTIIKSTNPNTLYELYVFFRIIDNISGEKKLKLMYEGNDYSFISQDELIRVYYRQIPKDFSNASLYKKLINDYDISGGVRQPDIIIQFKKENFYRIIEVKNTNNKKYIRDSIYKVLGYFKDFEFNSVDNSFLLINSYPIVLVTYGGIEFKENNQFKNKIIILNKNSFDKNVEKLVRY